MDRGGRLVRINERLAELNGLRAAEHLGRPLAEALPEVPQAAGALQRVLDTGRAELNIELTGEAPSAPGEQRHWRYSFYPVEAGGTLLGVGVLAEDITERKRAEARSAQLLEQAQEGVRSRDVFLAVAAHELRTPLTPLSLEVDTLLRAVRRGRVDLVAETGVDRLAIVRRQVTRLERLVNDLLDVSRIESGRLAVTPEELDLSAAVREVVDRHRDELALVGCPVTVSAASVTGWWDRLRVEQIVTNLLSNAMRYGPGRPIEVEVVAEGAAARIRVRDHGIGIAPEDQARIFARFERAASERHYGGLGMGLWIARQSAAAMGGTLTVESAPGRGATFTLTLPTRPADAPPLSASTSTGESACHPSS